MYLENKVQQLFSLGMVYDSGSKGKIREGRYLERFFNFNFLSEQ
jgi:hypothetical protein